MNELAAFAAGCILAFSVGCGSDDETKPTSAADAASSSAGPGGAGVGGMGGEGGGGGSGGTAPMVLESVAIQRGMVFPDTYTCAGNNKSPPLDWTAGPAATKGYAIVFKDETNNVVHWAIWDISASVLELASSVPNLDEPPVPKGSKQGKSYDDQTFGYLGPCPGGMEHTYTFTLYAVDVDALPDVTTASMLTEVETQADAHKLATASLSAKSSAM